MIYKTGRGNVAKKCLRFHAHLWMVLDYQQVTKSGVAASRHVTVEVRRAVAGAPGKLAEKSTLINR